MALVDTGSVPTPSTQELPNRNSNSLEELGARWRSLGCPISEYEAPDFVEDFFLFRVLLRARASVDSPQAKAQLEALAEAIGVGCESFTDLLWRSPIDELPSEGQETWCLDPVSGPPFRGWRVGRQWRHRPVRASSFETWPAIVTLWMPDIGIPPPADARDRLRLHARVHR